MTSVSVSLTYGIDPVAEESDTESEAPESSREADFIARFDALCREAINEYGGKKTSVVERALLKVATSASKGVTLVKILAAGSDDDEDDGLGTPSPDLPGFADDVNKAAQEAAARVLAGAAQQASVPKVAIALAHPTVQTAHPAQAPHITAASTQQPTVNIFDPYATYLNEVDSQRAFIQRGQRAIAAYRNREDDQALTDMARGIEGRAIIGGGEVRFRVTSSAVTYSDQYRNHSCRESLVDLTGRASPCYRYIKDNGSIYFKWGEFVLNRR